MQGPSNSTLLVTSMIHCQIDSLDIDTAASHYLNIYKRPLSQRVGYEATRFVSHIILVSTRLYTDSADWLSTMTSHYGTDQMTVDV